MKRIRISESGLLLTLGFLAFYVPASYAVPGMISKAWKLYYVMVTVLSVEALLFVSGGFRVSRRYLAAVLYFFWFYAGTSLFSENGTLDLYALIRCVGFVSLMELAFLTASRKTVLRAFIVAGAAMSGLQFLTFLIYSDTVGGMRSGSVYILAGRVMANSTQNWYFLTYDNDSINYFLPVMAALLCYALYYSRRALLWFCLYSSFVLYMYLTKTAATALIAVSVFLLVSLAVVITCVFPGMRPLLSLFSFRNAVLAGFLVQLLPVLIAGNDIAYRIAGYFGKKADFTGRGGIWRRSLQYFRLHPVSGNGIEDVLTRWRKIEQTHCHNMVVENLYTGGITALILLIILFAVMGPRVRRTADLAAGAVFSAAILSYLITGSMDWLSSNPIPFSLLFFVSETGCEERVALGVFSAGKKRIGYRTGSLMIDGAEDR